MAAIEEEEKQQKKSKVKSRAAGIARTRQNEGGWRERDVEKREIGSKGGVNRKGYERYVRAYVRVRASNLNSDYPRRTPSSFCPSPSFLPFSPPLPAVSLFRQEIETHSPRMSAPEASTNEIVHRYTRCLQSCHAE